MVALPEGSRALPEAPLPPNLEAMSEASLELQLTLYPDPLLRKVADPVTEFGEDLARTVAAMYVRMRASSGVGLAAPQVGMRRRILVLNESGEPEDDLVLVNPTIVSRGGEETTYEEGCLSFPGIYAEVRRPALCTVEYQDLSGAPLRSDFEGFQSRIVQHEYDHLEGVLLVDRMSPADKLRNKLGLEELVETYREKRGAAARR